MTKMNFQKTVPFTLRLLTKCTFHLVLILSLFVSTTINAQVITDPSQTTVDKLKAAYHQIKNPEISFKLFSEINAHVYENENQNRDAATLAIQDTYCAKVRAFCANGDFESGLDQNQWTGAYGFDYSGVLPNPFTLTYGFVSGALTDGNAHQTIVAKTSGNDPIVPAIPLVAANGGTKSLRLGNAVTGNGTEVLAKAFVVDPNETILNFYYAVVFQDPGHSYNDQPAFSVRVYDCATGSELPNVCNLGNSSNVVVSNAANPFFQSVNNSTYGLIAYKNWSLGQINLSAYVGKTVTIIFESKDCNLGGHFGYAYLDNIFSSQCPVVIDPTTQGSISLDTVNTTTCGVGKICAKYSLPSTSTATGTINISLDVYQAGTKLTTLSSGVLSTGTSYCFNINPASLVLNTALGGFDYVITGNFLINTFSTSLIVGNPPTGIYSGSNNDYLISCSDPNVYYSKPSGDLHNVLTWGNNPDGSGANPTDFGSGKTFQLANRASIYTMTGDWAVQGIISIQAGSQLQINGKTLSITSQIGTGTISGSTTSNLIVLPSGGAFTLNLTSGSSSLNNLTVSSGANTVLGSVLDIYNILTVNGTLNTGATSSPLLTFKSSASNTARLAPVTGTIVQTAVNTEQYIPARRAWRMMNSPLNGSVSIFNSWQESRTNASPDPNPFPGYGTHITGGPIYGSVANGFDQNPGAASSIKRYDNATSNWVPLQQTLTESPHLATMIFVRGDRGIPLGDIYVPPTVTTLRHSGQLEIGDVNSFVNPSGFSAIRNPYQSPVNFATLTRDNVQNNFYLWDPKMGGDDGVGAYVLISYNGSSYDVIPASVSPESQIIQTGQSFMVRTTTTSLPGSIIFKESDKSFTSTMNVNVFQAGGGYNSVSSGSNNKVSSQSNNNSVSSASNNSVSNSNAPVFSDPKEGQGLRISLKVPNKEGSGDVIDEVFSSYKLDYSDKVDELDGIKMPNMDENLGIVRTGETLMMERKSLPTTNDTIPLRLWNTSPKNYLFQFNPINLSGTDLSALLKDKYLKTTVPISLDSISKVQFAITNDTSSAKPDRFQIVLVAKKSTEAPIVMQTLSDKGIITAYPNPFNGKLINISFVNQKEGNYQITLLNGLGQVVYKRSIKYMGGSAVQTLQLDKKLAPGIYHLQVNDNKNKINIKLESN